MYCGDAHRATYGKHSLHHYFRHGAHCVYHTYTVLRLFEIAVCFQHLYLFRNLYCGDAHRANYDKQSLNNYFRNGAHCAQHILSVLKLFEIAVCFAHFRFFEIFTAGMRTVLTMANRVKIIISNMAHTVYIAFTVF